MRKVDIAAQAKTVVTSFMLAIVGAGLVVGVGLMARPSFSDIPNGIASGTPRIAVVKAAKPSAWASRDDIGVH